MGDLFIHDLSKFNCNVFIETGTGRGTGLLYAMRFNFNKLFSIEINEQLHLQAKRKFMSDKVFLSNGPTEEKLPAILSLIKKEDKILFWLDAHFPGADFQLGSYDDVLPDNIKLPLTVEMEIIYKYRKDCKDSFIIDDLQLFEDGEYEFKFEKEFIDKHKRSNEFIYKMYGETHNIVKNYQHQGFLLITPKE